MIQEIVNPQLLPSTLLAEHADVNKCIGVITKNGERCVFVQGVTSWHLVRINSPGAVYMCSGASRPCFTDLLEYCLTPPQSYRVYQCGNIEEFMSIKD